MQNESENENPSYYSIITATVRYDKNLNANEKLLFSEFTCLTNKYGYCYASNNYFAKLYDVTPQAISKWVKHLESLGYISCEYEYNGQEIKQRRITITYDVSTDIDRVSTNVEGGINNGLKGYQHTIKENNTSNNNTSLNIYGETAKRFVPPTVDEVKAYCLERKNNIDAQYFCDYYESKGWMIGKNKMKDWKCSVRTWEKNNFNTGRSSDFVNSRRPAIANDVTEEDIDF